MAEQIFKGKVKFPKKTYDELTAENPVPYERELFVCEIPSEEGSPQNSCIMLKIGDGVTPFNLLPWVSALSSDVYDWALQPTKPTYTIVEISGLNEMLSILNTASHTHDNKDLLDNITNENVNQWNAAEMNVIDEISVNGTPISPSDKSVNIIVPTNNNQLTNGAGYQTASQVQSIVSSSMGNYIKCEDF